MTNDEGNVPLSRRVAACPLVALLLTLAGPAFADPSGSMSEPPAGAQVRLPIAEAERPITLPRFVLSPTADLDVARLQANDTYGNLTGSAALGITDDFSVRLLVLPLQLGGPAGNGFHYGETSETRGPSVGATYRFVRGTVEVGAALDLRVFTAENITGGAIIPSVPVRIHATRALRIDVVPSLNITRATSTTKGETHVFNNPGSGNDVFSNGNMTSSANAVRLDLPVSVLYNVTEPIYIGLKSGLTIYDFSNVDNSTGIPLGIVAGYAIAGEHGPIFDIAPSFSFPYLILPGRSSVTNAGEYVIGLTLNGYFYL